jgi:hypothetical protein
MHRVADEASFARHMPSAHAADAINARSTTNRANCGV